MITTIHAKFIYPVYLNITELDIFLRKGRYMYAFYANKINSVNEHI